MGYLHFGSDFFRLDHCLFDLADLCIPLCLLFFGELGFFLGLGLFLVGREHPVHVGIQTVHPVHVGDKYLRFFFDRSLLLLRRSYFDITAVYRSRLVGDHFIRKGVNLQRC